MIHAFGHHTVIFWIKFITFFKHHRLVINKEIINAKKAHVYSDAAGENFSQLRSPKYTSSSDLSKFDIVLGGVYFGATGSPCGFTVRVKTLPDWILSSPVHIGIFESIAADLSQRIFASPKYFSNLKDQKKTHVTHHIDSSGDVYSLNKGSSECLISMSIASSFNARNLMRECADFTSLPRFDGPPPSNPSPFFLSNYLAWISTHRNSSDDLTRIEKLPLIMAAFPDLIRIDLPESVIPWEQYRLEFENFKGMIISKKRRAQMIKEAKEAEKTERIAKRLKKRG